MVWRETGAGCGHSDPLIAVAVCVLVWTFNQLLNRVSFQRPLCDFDDVAKTGQLSTTAMAELFSVELMWTGRYLQVAVSERGQQSN